jgi:hypothetical protein
MAAALVLGRRRAGRWPWSPKAPSVLEVARGGVPGLAGSLLGGLGAYLASPGRVEPAGEEE